MTAPAHPRPWLLSILLATLALLLAPAAGTAVVENLGPAPVRCGGEDGGTAGGCYGTRADVMDDTWLADLKVEPHVVHVGERLTATVAPLRDGVRWSWPVGNCADNAPSCTWKAESPTRGWALLGMSFPSPYGTGVEQDFYAVLQDLYAISGYVRDGDGKGVAGVAVAATGKRSARAATNVNGYYTMQVPKGDYSVSAGTYCVAGESGCARAKAVKTPGSKTVDFALPPRHTLEGTVTATSCGETSCSAPKGLGNVTVTAKATDGGETMTATTDGEGKYSLDLLEGTYRVTPSFEDRSFSPLDEVVRLKGDRSGVDFRTCVPDPGAPARRLPLETDPKVCIRLYRIDARAWIPYGGTFLDPLGTGAVTIPGTDYPMTATSPAIFAFSKGWPACGDGKNPLPGVRQIDLKKARATVTWRSSYQGHGHSGFGGRGLGGVDIPVLWDTLAGRVRILQGQQVETIGTLTRVYEYQIVPHGKTKPSERGRCTTTRKVVAAYTASVVDDRSVEILVSWQIPFKTFEDIDDVLASVDRIPKVDKATKKAAEGDWKAIDRALERSSETWRNLPDSAKEKFGGWVRGQLEKGYSKAKVLKQLDGVLDMLKKDSDAIVGHPVLKMAKKYVEILKKAEYPSLDLRLLVSFETAANGLGGKSTKLTVEAEADDFPSYGVRVLRREDGPDALQPLPWPPTGGILDPSTRMSRTGPYVLVDPSTVQVADGRVQLLAPERLRGGPGAKAALLAAMNVINNPLAHDTPLVGGVLVGGVARTMIWNFPNASS